MRASAANARTMSASPEPSWLASLQALAGDLPGLFSDRIELLSLELRRFGLVLAQMLVLLVAAAILAVTGWLALCGAATGALMLLLGLHWASALMLVLLLNLLACWLLLARLQVLAPRLNLAATRRHLTVQPPQAAAPATPTPEVPANVAT
ncbi:phage holin family protein [Paucibacter soli]|uniref:phage holin family protein n=1 Tax=Paucibacter soli TaxID=3133433 RepID=UPI0030AC2E4B